LSTEPKGIPRSMSKLASTSSRVPSPNRRNPKKLVSKYTEAHRAREVRTIPFICEESSSSLSML